MPDYSTISVNLSRLSTVVDFIARDIASGKTTGHAFDIAWAIHPFLMGTKDDSQAVHYTLTVCHRITGKKLFTSRKRRVGRDYPRSYTYNVFGDENNRRLNEMLAQGRTSLQWRAIDIASEIATYATPVLVQPRTLPTIKRMENLTNA